MKNISDHITYKEATRSDTAVRYGINNTPDWFTIKKMKVTANHIFEPVRNHFGVAIFVSSFFRCWELNKKVGGSKTSSHVKGEAIDIDDVLSGEDGPTNADIFHWIKDNLEFDQLIWEYGDDESPDWVHASYKGDNNRCQVLKTEVYKDWRGRKRTRYIPFV